MSAKRVIDLSHRMADGTVTYPDAPLPSVVEGGGSEGVVFAEPHTPRSTGDDRLLIDDLLHRADSAMYEAKRASGGVWMASALSL